MSEITKPLSPRKTMQPNQPRPQQDNRGTEPPVYPGGQPPVQQERQPQVPQTPPQERPVYSQPQQPVGAPQDPDAIRLKKKSRLSNFSGFFSLIQLIGGALILAFFINQFVFQSYQVFGSSMTPTLHEGDRLIVSKLGKSWDTVLQNQHVPKRGDIIVFDSPLNPNIQLVKRVIGLPGERVLVERGFVTVFNENHPNGFSPSDFYGVDEVSTQANTQMILGEDEIFVAGDNRTQGGSLDSRNDLGAVPLDNVVGELFIRVFPLSDAQVY